MPKNVGIRFVPRNRGVIAFCIRVIWRKAYRGLPLTALANVGIAQARDSPIGHWRRAIHE